MADAACVSNHSDYHSAKAHTCRCRVGTSTDPRVRSASVGFKSFPAAHESDQKTSHVDERSHRHPTIRSKNIAIQTLPNGRSLSTARERPRNNEESRMKRFVFKGVLAARTNRIFFWQQRHYADPPERPSYQPHTTEGVISGMKSEQTSRFSVIVRIPIGTPKLAQVPHELMQLSQVLHELS